MVSLPFGTKIAGRPSEDRAERSKGPGRASVPTAPGPPTCPPPNAGSPHKGNNLPGDLCGVARVCAQPKAEAPPAKCRRLECPPSRKSLRGAVNWTVIQKIHPSGLSSPAAALTVEHPAGSPRSRGLFCGLVGQFSPGEDHFETGNSGPGCIGPRKVKSPAARLEHWPHPPSQKKCPPSQPAPPSPVTSLGHACKKSFGP